MAAITALICCKGTFFTVASGIVNGWTINTNFSAPAAGLDQPLVSGHATLVRTFTNNNKAFRERSFDCRGSQLLAFPTNIEIILLLLSPLVKEMEQVAKHKRKLFFFIQFSWRHDTFHKILRGTTAVPYAFFRKRRSFSLFAPERAFSSSALAPLFLVILAETFEFTIIDRVSDYPVGLGFSALVSYFAHMSVSGWPTSLCYEE